MFLLHLIAGTGSVLTDEELLQGFELWAEKIDMRFATWNVRSLCGVGS
jgi:hypothetical protein